MLKFDKLKIVGRVECIQILDASQFHETYREGALSSLRYQQQKPFSLSIEINYFSKEVVVEFTGKILGEQYPKLICSDTIQECFERISALGICQFDVEAMMDADVVSCDVTQDVRMGDYEEMVKYINRNISNYQTYNCKLARTGSLTIEKNVVTSRNKKRMIIYDKGREMNTANNHEFVSKNGLQGEYDGICRFELNLKSKEQIRQSLQITDTSLRSVLSSTANPIADFLEDVIADEPEKCLSQDGWKDYLRSLVLENCGYDLGRVEAKVRQYKSSKTTSISKIMVPYRELLSRLKNDTPSISKDGIISRLNVSN